MIEDNKQYTIDGWAIYALVDIIKSLKHQIETDRKLYKKNEFIEILDRYDFTIAYLLNLKLNQNQSDIYNKDGMPEELKKLLDNLGIPLSKNKKDSNDKPSE